MQTVEILIYYAVLYKKCWACKSRCCGQNLFAKTRMTQNEIFYPTLFRPVSCLLLQCMMILFFLSVIQKYLFKILNHNLSQNLGWSCCSDIKGHIFKEIYCHLDIQTSPTISIHRTITALINFRKLEIPGKSSKENFR